MNNIRATPKISEVCDVLHNYVRYQTKIKNINYHNLDQTHKYSLKHYIRDHNLIVPN